MANFWIDIIKCLTLTISITNTWQLGMDLDGPLTTDDDTEIFIRANYLTRSYACNASYQIYNDSNTYLYRYECNSEDNNSLTLSCDYENYVYADNEQDVKPSLQIANANHDYNAHAESCYFIDLSDPDITNWIWFELDFYEEIDKVVDIIYGENTIFCERDGIQFYCNSFIINSSYHSVELHYDIDDNDITINTEYDVNVKRQSDCSINNIMVSSFGFNISSCWQCRSNGIKIVNLTLHWYDQILSCTISSSSSIVNNFTNDQCNYCSNQYIEYYCDHESIIIIEDNAYAIQYIMKIQYDDTYPFTPKSIFVKDMLEHTLSTDALCGPFNYKYLQISAIRYAVDVSAINLMTAVRFKHITQTKPDGI